MSVEFRRDIEGRPVGATISLEAIQFTPIPVFELRMERIGAEVIFSIVSTGEGLADFSDSEAGDVIGRVAVSADALRKELET